MSKKSIIILIFMIIFLLAFFSVLFIIKNSDIDTNISYNDYIVSDTNGNDLYENYIQNEDTETITIQGIVEVNNNGNLYIFNGQHFGEFGFEIEDYTSANIFKFNHNQRCIDYSTLEEHDISYIEDNDMLICTGYFSESGWENFITKDNPIIVLKSDDYNKIKKETLNNEREYMLIIGQYFASNYYNNKEIYLQYIISDKTYKLPFALKPKISDDTKIKGNLEKGKKVKVEYKDLNMPLDELELKSIEVIEN